MEGASTLAPGAVFGRYVLVEAIGRGAMGEVWGAIDPDLDRKIALKLLRSDRNVRPEDRARLAAEARSMARLTHPNVVTIHDVGELGEQLFIAMEFVAGETLDRWIARGPHACEEVLAIMRQAAAGLAAAHAVGLVHRDFKPANVMIGLDGRVRVLDFGLARPDVVDLSQSSSARALSSEGEEVEAPAGRRIQGSPAYMSPEQHRAAPVDARSDLFSFCVTLFEALYGVRPFRGNNRLTVALAIVESRVVELPADVHARVPDWIHAIVMRGLASDPAQRFPDMDALLAALERSPEQLRQRRVRIAGAVVGVAAVVGLAVALWPEPAPDACDAAGDAITQEWNVEARTRLRTRLDAVEGAPPLAGQRVAEGLDQHVQRWAEASVQLCRDRRARRLTERLQSMREACLVEQREAVRALVRLGDGGDPAWLRGLALRPFAAVRALGDPSECIDRAAPADDRAVPDEAQSAARIELQLALALLDEPVASELLARVGSESDGDPELALLLGRAAAKRGDRAEAEARLHAAAAEATSSEPSLAGLAWLSLIELELAVLEGAEAPTDVRERTAMRNRAAQLIDYADALLPAHEPDARGELGLLAGRLALLDEPATHPVLLDAAIDRLAAEQLLAPDLLLKMLDVRARLHERRGDDAAAADDRAQARQLALAAFGSAVGPAE